jgi:hypothetical protein
MGIQNQHSILYKTIELHGDHIFHTIQKKFEEDKASGLTARERPAVAIDANLLGFSFLSSKSSIGCIKPIKIIAKAFAEKSFDVIIIVDGEDWHDSKRATPKRIADCERSKVQGFINRLSLAGLRQQGSSDENKMKALENKIKNSEKVANRYLPPDFYQVLKQFADEFQTSTCGTVSCERAPLQADPQIAKKSLDAEVDAIISGDSDFQMFVGPEGLGDLNNVREEQDEFSPVIVIDSTWNTFS